MANINASLLEALNGKAPQHKQHGLNNFEFSEGSDGALHIKVTDVNGNPVDPREVDNGAIIAELQAVKAENQLIKQQLQGTLDTRLTGSIQDYVILANAIAYTEIGFNDYSLVGSGGMVASEVRQYKNFKISFVNDHDQPATIKLYTSLLAHGASGATVQGEFFAKTGVLGSGGRLILSPNESDATANRIHVPELANALHSNITVRIEFETAPTTGSVTCFVEMN